jgi:hypothetical protein
MSILIGADVVPIESNKVFFDPGIVYDSISSKEQLFILTVFLCEYFYELLLKGLKTTNGENYNDAN